MAQTPRLFLDVPLNAEATVSLERDHAHYLFGVLRRAPGDEVEVFNGRDGAWKAVVDAASKKSGMLRIVELSKMQRNPPDLWILFAPIKKARTDFIVEKATEMGASAIQPVQTDYTNAERIRLDRLQAHAVEAAEQCGGTFVPPVRELAGLPALLDAWPAERRLMFCDETLQDEAASLPDKRGPWAILIGPEGGFSPAERERLAAMDAAHPVSLGPRILRADTAAVAAMALWQSRLGDWS